MLTNHYSEIFNLSLNKDENRQRNCLFNLPKEEIYIRGEESLGKLKFANAEDLILLSINMMKKRRNIQMAEYSRQYLYLDEIIRFKEEGKDHNILNSIKNTSSKRPNSVIQSNEKLLTSVIYLWKTCTLFKNRIVQRCFHLDPKEESKIMVKEPIIYYSPELSKIKNNSLIQRKGHLHHYILDAGTNKDPWIKSFVVIQRPYLYIYKHKNCIEIVDVINLLDAKVSYNTEVMKTMNKENIFEVYTPYHNIYLQASNKKDMIQWLNTIDPLGVGAAMSNVHQQK
jgi:hypothetical protein